MTGEAEAHIQLCGRFVVDLAGDRMEDALPGRKGRVLFAYLVLNRGRALPRGELLMAGWGEDAPAEAANALSVLLSKLRRGLGADRLRGRAEIECRQVTWPHCLHECWPQHLGVEGSAGSFAAAGGFAGAESVGLGAGLEDVGVEGDPVDDGGDQAGVGEHGSPFAEGQVRGDRDGRSFFAFGDDLEEQLGAAGVDFDVSELVQTEQVEASVAADHSG